MSFRKENDEDFKSPYMEVILLPNFCLSRSEGNVEYKIRKTYFCNNQAIY